MKIVKQLLKQRKSSNAMKKTQAKKRKKLQEVKMMKESKKELK